MRMISKLALGAVSMLALFAGPAMADNNYAGFSGYVALTSDYRFRGISNSDLHPTVQGAINWAGDDGWYAGSWGSGIDFNDPPGAGSSIEVDLYGGKHFDLDGTDLNVEAYYYWYPDQPAGAHYSYYETIVGLSHPFENGLTVGAQAAWSPEFFGKTGDGWWVAANASYAVADWVSVSGNVGHQWVDLGLDYTHWDAGVTFTWNQFALDVRYIDTSEGVATCFSHICDATVNATLTFNIPG